MTRTKLSHAIKLVLAAQVGATMLAATPAASAQQMPASGSAVYPQGGYVVQQQAMQQPIIYQQQAPRQQVVYAQPQQMQQQPVYQQPQPQMIYAQPQGAYAGQQPVMVQQPQQQMIYRPPMQQQVYAQPLAPMYQQPVMQAPQVMMRPAAPVQQSQYPQSAVMYPQGVVMQPQGNPYGNVLMQQPPQMYQAGVTPQGAVVYQQGGPLMQQSTMQQMPGQQAPVMVYPNGMPVQQPAAGAYNYSGQAPQGAVMYPNGMVMQPAAATGLPIAGATAGAAAGAVMTVPAGQLVVEEPRLQTGSANKLTTQSSSRPVQTLTADDLSRVNAVNVESALNTLPQLIPGLDASSNNPGNGRATADIRGLGNERTAVLVNGRPFAPSNSSGTADLNAIPRALIKQVDVSTGGSSVAYGSGAIAGAVNFVLEENFQGAELDVSHQSAEQGGSTSSVELTVGSAFANGRGNIALSLGGSERDSVLRGEREFSTFVQTDETDQNGNIVLVNGGSTGVPGTSIFSGALGTFSDSFGVIFDPDGSVRPYQTGTQNDAYNFSPVNYLQIPQSRRNATAIANFEITDSLELYGLGMFSRTETAAQLASTPIFQNNTKFTLDGSPFLPSFTQQVLSEAFGDGIDTDGDGIDDTATAFIRRRLLESGPRRSTLDSSSEYVQVGLRGEFGTAFEYDIYASRGATNNVVTQEGNVSRSRFLQSMLLDLQADPNGGVCQQSTSDSTAAACVPANIFGEGNISPEAADFIAAGVTIDSKNVQSIYGARLTGKLGSLPGGEARITVGAERRENSSETQWNRSNLAGANDQAGFGTGVDFEGETSSESVYGGVYLPLISGVTGAELVDLELGYRLTDYTTTQGVASYGANGSWAPTEFVRVRAGYNRAHRAPNIQELFTPQSEGFPSASDPCSASGSPNGVSPEVAAICIATGVPSGVVGTPIINPASGQVRAISGGNPDLQEEQADTYSVGLEFTIPLGDDGRLRAGADYFSVSGSQAIAPFGGGAANVLNNCYDPGISSGDALSPFCDVVNRRPDGTIDSIELNQQNEAFFEVEGVDLFAGVSLPALGGSVGLEFNGTVLNKHQFTAFDGADPLECAGRFGDLCGEPLPSYSHRMSAGWSNENLAASLIWRHIGEVNDDDDTNNYAVEKLGARDYLDAELNVSLANSLGLAVGIQNLTDVGAPVIGENQEQSNTFPATYGTLGRTYFVRLTGTSTLDGK